MELAKSDVHTYLRPTKVGVRSGPSRRFESPWVSVLLDIVIVCVEYEKLSIRKKAL